EAMQLSAKGLGVKSAPKALSYSSPSEVGEAEVRGETAADDDSPESEARRQANAKNRSRQKSKQQRKSRKNNR
ncbi:MAG: hypothetical protein ABWX57_09415, partial [Aeromicrobium sp.]